MNKNEIDQAAQDQEDSESMVEAVTDRKIFAGMDKGVPKKTEQLHATDFTRTVPPSPVNDVFSDKLDYMLQVGLNDGRWITVGHHPSLDAALQAELAINQVMIEYRTKRNAWEKDFVARVCGL